MVLDIDQRVALWVCMLSIKTCKMGVDMIEMLKYLLNFNDLTMHLYHFAQVSCVGEPDETNHSN